MVTSKIKQCKVTLIKITKYIHKNKLTVRDKLQVYVHIAGVA